MKSPALDLDHRRIETLCRRFGIKELYVFGAALRGDFRAESDIDFVVRMEAGVRLRFRELMQLEDELAALTGRSVDVVLGTELDSPDANPYRKRHILTTMEPIFGR